MVNKVILIGNVGMDPEVRAMEGGVKVARIRLATTERYRDRQSNENKEHTEWHTITLWRGLADVVDNYVRKGSQIYVEGRLRTREWTDQQGNKQEQTEWHSVTLWQGLADVVDRYVHKGSQVYIEGKIRTREYDKNGEMRYATEIIAEEMKLCGRAKDVNELPV